jgi:ribosomal protein S18 acetylase RimI-like enzyme
MQMCDLLAELFAMEADFSADREKQRNALTLLVAERLNSSLTVVAVKGYQVIGMCSIQALISTAEGGPAGFVEDVIILGEYRGQGVGTAMLDVLLSWCRARGMTRVQLLADKDNEKALAFYGSRGWESTNLVCLRKQL